MLRPPSSSEGFPGTSAEELREAALAVGQGGGHMLGVVLTNVSDPGRGSRSVQAGVTHTESATV